MAIPTAPNITNPANLDTLSQPFTLTWDESVELVVNPPVAAFTFTSLEYEAPSSDPPAAGFTFTSSAVPPTAGFTFTSE